MPRVIAAIAIAVICLSSVQAAVVKRTLRVHADGKDLLKHDGWRPSKQGFRREGDCFVCDNAAE